jgi:hypothetical protein
MVFVTNIYNPNLKDSECEFVAQNRRFYPSVAAINDAWKKHLEWVKNYTIGEPVGNEYFSAMALRNLNFIGLYIDDDRKGQGND